ncbi:MAG: transporter [Herminiimonas sp.]|nr:transporter [Herminiimonas sp.]
MKLLPFIVAMLLCAGSGAACASGFALSEMSAAGVGSANAGGAAAAEDISTIFFNPAGLMRSSGRQFMASGSGIRPSAKFENRGSLSALGTPLAGGNGGDAGTWAFVPALFYAMDAGPGLRFGIGVHAPFGLKTDYEAGWVGRYQALKSELRAVNINPVLAYRPSDSLSLGIGVSAQYIDVELSRAIDFGTICLGALGAARCAPAGLLPQAADGKVTVDGSDWGYGFNLGALYAPGPAARFGIAWRSRIIHRLSGDARFERPARLPAPLAAAPAFANTGSRADVDLPELASLSATLELNPKWTLMSDLSWQHWSRFRELRIRFDNGAPDSVTPQQWRNTFRFAVGVNHHYSDRWKLRSGIAWDQTPVKSAFRTPRIPDNNRLWLALGAQYRPSQQSAWDIGYAHLFMNDTSINKAEPPVGGTLIGNYSSDVNILSVQYNYSF